MSEPPVVVREISVSRPLSYQPIKDIPGEVELLRVSLKGELKSRFLILIQFVFYLLPLQSGSVSYLYKASNVYKRKGSFGRDRFRARFYLFVYDLITLNPYITRDLFNLYVPTFYIPPEGEKFIL